ncbi:hypothetical protein IFO70_16535 [Phormidium tenue FACHB-886]|nr:hypothetical protein [Phormidium tenue FACHB-886]
MTTDIKTISKSLQRCGALSQVAIQFDLFIGQFLHRGSGRRLVQVLVRVNY